MDSQFKPSSLILISSIVLVLLIIESNVIIPVSGEGTYSKRVRASGESRKDYKDIKAFIKGSCGQFKPKIKEQTMLPLAFQCEDDDDKRKRVNQRGERKSENLRLGGGWSASQAFKSHVIINFSGTTTDDQLRKWRCSGTMIDNDIALTAQSCIDRPDITKVGSMTLNYDEIYYGIGYCILDGFKLNEDKTYNNDIGIVRFNITSKSSSLPGKQPDCIELDMRPKRGAICAVVAEGDRTNDDDDISAKNLKTKALFIENRCPTDAAKELTHSDQTCWSPYKGAKKYEGNLCDFDKGSPVFCMDHCGPGLPRFVLIGLVSSIVPRGKEPIASSPCDKTRPHPDDAIIVTNFNEISEKLTSKLNVCLEDPVRARSKNRAGGLIVV